MTTHELTEAILRLKAEKRAVILAHYYTPGEVQAVADFVGDSLALAVQAQKADADIILFAGVRFMGETAKVLCPERKVLLPDPEADCSLAQACNGEQLAAFKAQHPDAVVVSYVNTTAEVKAHTDICCTSSNALRVVESIPEGRCIIATGPLTEGKLAAEIDGLFGQPLHFYDAAAPIVSAESIDETFTASEVAFLMIEKSS